MTADRPDLTRRNVLIAGGLGAVVGAFGEITLSTGRAVAAGGCWLWPNGTTSVPRVTSEFGPRASPGGVGSTNHLGIDLIGFTYNRAAGDGTVIFAGLDSGWGYVVRVSHPGGYTTVYAHNVAGSLTVARGDLVIAGQILGTMGRTGNVTGVHLHFETRISGVAIDPRTFMADRIAECANDEDEDDEMRIMQAGNESYFLGPGGLKRIQSTTDQAILQRVVTRTNLSFTASEMNIISGYVAVEDSPRVKAIYDALFLTRPTSIGSRGGVLFTLKAIDETIHKA